MMIEQNCNDMYKREQLIASLMTWKQDTFQLGHHCEQATKYSMLDLEMLSTFELKEMVVLLKHAEYDYIQELIEKKAVWKTTEFM